MLDHFINVNNISFTVMKHSSLHKSVSKLMPKKFYEIEYWNQCYKTYM